MGKIYRPNLPKDTKYLKKVAATISKKEPIENIQFKNLIDVLQTLNINENPYNLVTLENFNPDFLQKIIKESFYKVRSLKSPKIIKKKLDRLWDYLAEPNPVEKADLIFVFGGRGKRAEKAIELYQAGYSDKILFSGGWPSYLKTSAKSEVEKYAATAVKKGVPKENLILETQSINTPENVVNSIKTLKKKKFLPKKIILVNISYQTRRAYLTFKTNADWNPKLIRAPFESEKFNRKNYFNSKEVWTYVFNEYMKLHGARLMKHF
jgi:uncharacterized SAM-binding protein YcdF (DUF218 family)